MILVKIQKIIGEQLGISNLSSITKDTYLKEDLEADSLDAAEIIMAIEDEFGIDIDDNEIENFKTIKDICNYVEDII